MMRARPASNQTRSATPPRALAGDRAERLPASVREVLGTAGQPLSPNARAQFEPRFGHDFSRVRVHADARAAQSAHDVAALAYTIGEHVVFGAQSYAPHTHSGQRLLAHELAHVVQQSASQQSDEGVRTAAPRYESEADAYVQLMESGARPPPLSPAPVALARQQPPNAAAEPAEDATEEEVEWVPDEDKMAGSLVSKIIIDVNTGRVGFITNRGMIRGNVSTDLKTGRYTATYDAKTGEWVFRAGQVKAGERFIVSLQGALPHTLSYLDNLPVEVGFSNELRTGGDLQSDVDLMRLGDEMAEEVDPQEALAYDNFMDFEYAPQWTVTGDSGSYSTQLTLVYYDGGREDIDVASVGDTELSGDAKDAALADTITTSGGRIRPKLLNRSTTPQLWQLKQKIHLLHQRLKEAGEEELFDFIVNDAFPAVFTVITINPFVAPMSGVRPSRLMTPKSRGVQAKGTTGPAKAPPAGEGAAKVPPPKQAPSTPKTTPAKAGKQPAASAPTTTREDARQAMVKSEGKAGPGSNVGHAGDHAALKGQDPKALAQSRPTKANTTTWRSPRQAQQDLRDIIAANKKAIDALPADGTTTTGGVHRLPESRYGFNSQFGKPATDVTFNSVTWRIARMPNGRLHVVHFAPSL